MGSELPSTKPPGRLWGIPRAGAVVLCAIAVIAPFHQTFAQSTIYPRVGKVLIIRGAFSVFSLGLDTLGEKLERRGVDVAVVPAFMASSATAELAAQTRCNRCREPIVLIGHSKGAHFTADCARQLQAKGRCVDLVIMLDNPNRATMPGNVRRCVNYYHTNLLGIFHGLPASSDLGPGHVCNVDIDLLPCRAQGGYIDHFNMDSSDWIHCMIIHEVLRVCRPCRPCRCGPSCCSPGR